MRFLTIFLITNWVCYLLWFWEAISFFSQHFVGLSHFHSHLFLCQSWLSKWLSPTKICQENGVILPLKVQLAHGCFKTANLKNLFLWEHVFTALYNYILSSAPNFLMFHKWGHCENYSWPLFRERHKLFSESRTQTWSDFYKVLVLLKIYLNRYLTFYQSLIWSISRAWLLMPGNSAIQLIQWQALPTMWYILCSM